MQQYRPIVAAAPLVPSFSVATLSDDERFTLLTGGYHPAITDVTLRRRVMSAVLIAVGQWMAARERWMAEYQRDIAL